MAQKEKALRAKLKLAVTPSEVAVHKLKAEGVKVAQIARMTGWSRPKVYRLLKSYDYKTSSTQK